MKSHCAVLEEIGVCEEVVQVEEVNSAKKLRQTNAK